MISRVEVGKIFPRKSNKNLSLPFRQQKKKDKNFPLFYIQLMSLQKKKLRREYQIIHRKNLLSNKKVHSRG